MTGLTETEYLVAALESGCVDYVTKPINPKEVLARMQVHLRGARERRQTFRLHQQTGDSDAKAEDGDWLIVMREVSDSAVIEAMSLSFKLTAKEAEVLYWVVKGKTNKDIGDILGSSPMTVKKHLERIFVKMGWRHARRRQAWP